MKAAAAVAAVAALSLGPAVVEGRVRYVSVSQLEKFDPATGGGCHRKWWFRYVARVAEPARPAAKLGDQCHAQIEHYLRTGEDVLGDIVRAGLRFIPSPGSDLLVEYSFARIGEDGSIISPLLAGDIPVVGKVDLAHARGEWLNDEGELIGEPHMVEVVDWKTTKTIETTYDEEGNIKARGWAKTAEQIEATWQMRGYARLAATLWPEAEVIRLGHGYFQTAGRRAAKKISTTTTPLAACEAWDASAMALSTAMKVVASTANVEDVAANYAACSAFGGCPYREQCPRDPKMVLAALGGGGKVTTMGSILEKYKARLAAPATAAAPAAVSPEVAAEMAKLEAEEAASAPKVASSITPPDAPTAKDIALPPEPVAAAVAEAVKLTAPGAPCPASGTTPAIDVHAAVEKKYACACGSSLKISPHKLGDGYFALVPKHNAGEAAEKKAKTKAKVVEVMSTSTVSMEALTAAGTATIAPSSGLALYLDCREDGARAERLEVYAEKLAAELAKAEGAADIRCAPEKSALSFGKWKGALAAYAKEAPPPAGAYEVSSSSELALVVFEALAPTARRVVRG